MKSRLFYKNFYAVLGIDLLLFALSFLAAHLVRFEFQIPQYIIEGFSRILPIVLLVKLLCFYFFDLYRGMWRFTSIADLLNIIKASSFSSLLIICFILLKYRFIGFSRSVFIIDWCFTILFISGFRLAVRFYFEATGEEQTWFNAVRSLIGPLKRKIPGSKNLLIIGAGNCGEKIYKES